MTSWPVTIGLSCLKSLSFIQITRIDVKWVKGRCDQMMLHILAMVRTGGMHRRRSSFIVVMLCSYVHPETLYRVFDTHAHCPHGSTPCCCYETLPTTRRMWRSMRTSARHTCVLPAHTTHLPLETHYVLLETPSTRSSPRNPVFASDSRMRASVHAHTRVVIV
jgi:hypothetical protein